MRFLINIFLFGEFLHLGDGEKKVNATYIKSFFGKAELEDKYRFFLIPLKKQHPTKMEYGTYGFY
jgi:hypothetical protein